ncbi:Clp protease N-terminal domain-containing protein [Streptomyces sp. NPDC048483]|uniref:Clp protease N-terminal domain-containing protein n=1 Tax=Streptomyces sp. NPDC048483 TaxID=3154927 RepID=UPI0034303283
MTADSARRLERAVDRLMTQVGRLADASPLIHLGRAEIRRLITRRTVFASLHHEFVRAGTNDGPAAADRARGKTSGRPPRLSAEQIEQAQQLYDSGASAPKIARPPQSRTATVYRRITLRGASETPAAMTPGTQVGLDKCELSRRTCLMPLPDLDDLIAEVDRTCDAAHRPGEQEQPDWLALLTVAASLAGQLQVLADDLVEDYVEHCRMHGSSWTDIGTALGVTRQAVQQRFHAPHKRYSPETMTSDLRQAMAHVKQAAVQHRNNYIGTEHVLWGLTAEDNNATRILKAAGVSPETVHRSVGTRLSMGASQAAERIAWTPYSRKAIAIAEARSEQYGSDHIDCDDLLIGLARVGRGVAAAVLRDAGLEAATLDDAASQLPDTTS